MVNQKVKSEVISWCATLLHERVFQSLTNFGNRRLMQTKYIPAGKPETFTCTFSAL
jgi:hypothetical protein